MRIGEIISRRRPVFSVEFFPPKTPEGREELLATAHTLADLDLDFVSVTYGAGGSNRDGTVDITTALKEEVGLEVMAHLSCVGETAAGLDETLGRLRDAGVDNIFALRGDPPQGQTDFVQPVGGFGSAAELAAHIAAGYEFSIGGACFPEVHPEAPDLDTDLTYLKSKVDAGAEFLITQLFFDNRVYFEFVEAARAKGIEVPIIAGIIPTSGYAHTKRVCDRCQASIPAELEKAMRAVEGDAEAEFNLGVAYAAQQAAELLVAGAPGIHFYALNKAPATRAVLASLRAAEPWRAATGAAARA